MTKTTALESIVSLTETFQQTLGNHIGQPFSLRPGIVGKLSVQEHQDLINAAMDLHDDALAYVSVGDCDDEFLRKSLLFTEKFAAIAMKAVPVAELQKMIPAQLKTAESIAFLKAESAPVLATLCA